MEVEESKNMVEKYYDQEILETRKGKEGMLRQEIRERSRRKGLLADLSTKLNWALEIDKSQPVIGYFSFSSFN